MIAALVLMLFSGVLSQDEKPPLTMTYIKYRLEGPGLSKIGQMPKELWRIGDFDMRTLEPADTAKKIWPLIIYTPPDFWIINLFDSTGRHSVNPGPTYESYAPIFSFRKEESFMQLQFGFEKRFLSDYFIDLTESKVSDGMEVDVYNFELVDAKISMLFNKKTQAPISATAVIDTMTYKVIYEEYMTGLAPESALFFPPVPDRISEMR